MLIKLKDRLFITILLLCLFSILLVSVIFREVAENAVYEHYKVSTLEQMKLSDQRIAQYLHTAREIVMQLAAEPAIQMTDGKLRHFSLAEADSALITREADRAIQLFFQYRGVHPEIKNIHLITNDGGYAFLILNREMAQKDLRTMKVFTDAMATPAPQLVNTVDPSLSVPSVFIAQRVSNLKSKPFGVMLVEVNMNVLQRQIIGDDDERLQLVVSQEGKILLSDDASAIGLQWDERKNDEIVNQLRLQQGKSSPFFTYTGKAGKMYGILYTSPTTGYTFVESIPASMISRQLDRLELILMGVALVVVLLSALIAHLISNWIGKPISRLVAATEAIQQGDFSVRVPVGQHGVKEIRQLKMQFNQMAAQIEELLLRERRNLKIGMDQIVRSFYLAVEMKDTYTAGHTERVTRYALIIYDYLDKAKLDFSREDLRYAGLMHDIGKVAIPDRVLLKEGKLTDEEYEMMKLHASIGADIVEQIESLAHVSPGVRHHHERWDGRGYPAGLKGEEIPLMGRILAIADTFDAMTSTRSYRKAVTPDMAHNEIVRCSGSQFDPALVEIFCKAYADGAFLLEAQQVAEVAAAADKG